MKKDSIWLRIGLVLFIAAIARKLFDAVGGLENIPYEILVVFFTVLIIYFAWISFNKKNKLNNFQKNMAKAFVVFFGFSTVLLGFIGMINSRFQEVWIQYKEIFIFLVLLTFVLFVIYIILLMIKNKDMIK